MFNKFCYSLCSTNDDCSSESSYYRPGFQINYGWDESSNGEKKNGSISKANIGQKNIKQSKPSTINLQMIKDRCRIAYSSSGGSYAIEGHGKM